MMLSLQAFQSMHVFADGGGGGGGGAPFKLFFFCVYGFTAPAASLQLFLSTLPLFWSSTFWMPFASDMTLQP